MPTLVIEDIERLGRLGEEGPVDERRGRFEHRAGSAEKDQREDDGRADQHEIRGRAKQPKRDRLDGARRGSLTGKGFGGRVHG